MENYFGIRPSFCELILNGVLLLREILTGTADPFKRLGESSQEPVSSKELLRHPHINIYQTPLKVLLLREIL